MTATNAGDGRWTKRLIGGLGALALVAMAFTLTTMGMNNTGVMPMWDGHMWGMGGGLGWGLMWIVGLFWMVILVAIPIVLIYWFVGGRTRTDEEADDGALTVLRERYARGEIDDEEYEARRAKLEAH